MRGLGHKKSLSVGKIEQEHGGTNNNNSGNNNNNNNNNSNSPGQRKSLSRRLQRVVERNSVEIGRHHLVDSANIQQDKEEWEIKDLEFRERENETTNSLRNILKKVTDRCKKIPSEQEKFKQSLDAYSATMEKMSVLAKQHVADSVYAPALNKFSEIHREMDTPSSLSKPCPTSINNSLFLPDLDLFIDQISALIIDITNEVKLFKSKIERNKKDLETNKLKLSQLVQKKAQNLEIIKIFNLEKQLYRSKTLLLQSLDEGLLYLDEIDKRKTESFIEWVVGYFLIFKKEENLKRNDSFREIYNYLEELTTWCIEAKAAYVKDAAARDARNKGNFERAKEKAFLYEGLVKVIREDKRVRKAIMDVGKVEGIRIPGVNKGTEQEMEGNIEVVHEFLRAKCANVCMNYLNEGGDKRKCVELIGALGFLEKEKIDTKS